MSHNDPEDFNALVTAFVEAALDDPRRAGEMLAAQPKIADAGFFPALVLGNAVLVESLLRESPSLATAKGGPRNWEPLLYVCFSRLGGDKLRAAAMARTAQILLEHGAAPNAFYIHPDWPNSPLPCLYGAAGLNNNTELTRVLVESGANLNDSESLYHSTEHSDLACFRLLLQYGASPKGTNALRHMLDREAPEGLRLLLAAGADPNERNQRQETALHWAVWRGRSAGIIEMLLDAGAEMDARRSDGRTAYVLAKIGGQNETAALLEKRGADRSLSEADGIIASYASAGAPLGIQVPPECHRFLPEFAANHRTAAVRAMLADGVPVDTRGEHGGTALHWACWKGYADLVKVLLNHGASLTIEDFAFHAPPAGWFSHGLQNCGEGDYPAVARLLLDHGVTMAARDIPSGDAAVDEVLKERGLL